MAKSKKSLLPKRGSQVAACHHVMADIDDELDFEDQFNELLVIHSDDGKYRFYLLCPQSGCSPEGFENLYIGVYPALIPLSLGHPQVYRRFREFCNKKLITHQNLSQLTRQSELGDNPSQGDLVHICEHFNKPWKVMNILDASDVQTAVEDESGNIEIEVEGSLTHLIICPDCHAEITHPRQIGGFVSSETMTARMAQNLAKCRCIYQTLPGFIQFLQGRADAIAAGQEEEVFDERFPAIGALVQLCEHLLTDEDPLMRAELGLSHPDMESLTQDSPPLDEEGFGYLLACESCEGEEDVKTSLDPYLWTDEDTIKLLIKQFGGSHIFPDGLSGEALVNRIASLLNRPELTFNDSIAWELVNIWATEYFGVAISIAFDEEEEMTEEELREAQRAGDLWVIGRGHHPVTGELEVMARNDTVFLQDYNFEVMVTIEWGDYDDEEEREAIHNRMEEELTSRVDPNGGVTYQRLTRMSRGEQIWFFVFEDEFAARLSAEQLEHIEGVIDVNVRPIED